MSGELREVLGSVVARGRIAEECIREYDQRIEQIARDVYPEVALPLLKRVKGVGTQITLIDIKRRGLRTATEQQQSNGGTAA